MYYPQFPYQQQTSHPNLVLNNRQQFSTEQYSYENNPRGKCSRRNGNQRRNLRLRYPNRFRNNNNKQNQTKDDNEVNANKPIEENRFKIWICPGCHLQYDCVIRNDKYTGKVPLILNCKHTVCQECIIKSFSGSNVLCYVCNNPSIIKQRNFHENPQDTFTPNFHVFGYILWSKSQHSDNLDLSLAPVEVLHSPSPTLTPSSVKCCFLSCNKPAILNCQECSDVYCGECCTTLHKSVKALWSHNQVPISKLSIALAKCTEHNNMDVEFFCITCNCGACCYCLIEKHTGHDKDHLSKLNEEELAKFLKYKEKASDALKRLLRIRKKIENLAKFNIADVQQKINECFIGLHSKLQFLERSLQNNVKNSLNIENNKSLDIICSQVEKSIEELKNIFTAMHNSESQKINLKELLKILEANQNLPSYLVYGNDREEPIKFVVDTILDNIEDYFKITSCSVQFSLLSEEQLPENYHDHLENESDTDIESIITKTSKKEKKTDVTEKRRIQEVFKKNYKNIENTSAVGIQTERVDVTHIESIDCFYVQQSKMQYKLHQMNREVDNAAKLAPRIDCSMLSINNLCLAFYETNREKFWSRGRITEIKNGENGPLYEIFFIDYGNTKSINISNIREIPSVIAQRKPFAIQCELYNPTGLNWGKNAHIHMGKIINGKEVFMLVKKVYSGIHEVDLKVTNSDRGLTSVIDMLINTFTDSLSTFSDSSKTSDFSEGFLQQNNIHVNEYKIFSNSVHFEKKQIIDVTIANVIDPHNICIHIAKYADAFKKLLSSMKSYYKRKKNYNFVPIEGSFVVVEHKDPIRGNIHRALVKKFDINSGHLSVYCIDWGINVTVSLDNIKMLTEEFTKLESQAVFVKLVHVEPYKNTLVWSEQSVQFLQRYFRTQEVLKMVVHIPESMEVALFEKGNATDFCINAMLVHKQLAESNGKVSQLVEWPSDQSEVPAFSEDGGLVEALLKKVGDVSDSDSTDEEANKIAKQKIDVYKCVSPDLIYVKFVCIESSEETLHQELQIHYFKEHNMREFWSIGDICVALYDKSYFRGKILSIVENKYNVNLYDIATEVQLPIENIFEYDKYFNKYPNMVFKAHLANIAPAGGDKWSTASIEATQKIFDTYQDILATKVSSDTSGKSMPLKIWYAKVKIKDALEASVIKYKCVNDLLIKLGYAYKKLGGSSETGIVKENIGTPNNQVGDICEDSDDVNSSSKQETDSIKGNYQKFCYLFIL